MRNRKSTPAGLQVLKRNCGAHKLQMITPRKREDDDDASTGTSVSSDGEPGRQRNSAEEVEEAVERKVPNQKLSVMDLSHTKLAPPKTLACLPTLCCGVSVLVAAVSSQS